MSDESSAKSFRRLFALILVLVLVAGGYLTLQYFRKSLTQPSAEVGQTIAEDFLKKVRAGDPGKAWDSSTAEFKSIEGRESFIRKSKSTTFLKEQLQFVSSQQVMIQDERRTEYLFQSPKAKVVRILIGHEQGNWKVDRLTF